MPQNRFIKHVNSRWLTLENAVARLLEQWKAVKIYFLKFIPQNRDNLLKSRSYKLITELLKEKDMKIQLMFICSSARIFTRFTGSFQKNEPMIPLDIDIDLLQDEWRLLTEEKDLQKNCRIDQYWSQVFNLKTSRDEVKYPTITSVVKLVLCLYHGKAELERGFSNSARYLTDDKASMNERTLNAAMTVKIV